MHNWRRYPFSKWYTKLTKKRGSKFGALLWRHLTRRHREKPQHRCTTIQSILYTTAEKDFGKFTSCIGLLVRTHCTCSFRAVFGLLYELRHLLSALGSDMRKIFYIGACTSEVSAQTTAVFKSLSYLYEVVRTNFSADFWTFRNF